MTVRTALARAESWRLPDFAEAAVDVVDHGTSVLPIALAAASGRRVTPEVLRRRVRLVDATGRVSCEAALADVLPVVVDARVVSVARVCR